MNRHPKTTAFAIATLFLTLFAAAARPCPAQTATGDKARTAEEPVRSDAPENDMGLFISERGFRTDVTYKVTPEYPAEALKDGAQGVVVLSLYHDAEGNASHIKVVGSPHTALAWAAITAVEQWKWRKFRNGGIDRPVLSALSFRFIIEEGVGRVEDPPGDGGLKTLSEVQPLRLKATWPDERSRPARKGGRD